MVDLLEEVKRTYRNARGCGKAGPGTHRTQMQNAIVHDHWIRAVQKARDAGLDWQGAMAEVRAE